MEQINLFYLDNKLCQFMSSLYTEDFRRFDWLLVELALERGQEVRIKKADENQREWANKTLNRLHRGV